MTHRVCWRHDVVGSYETAACDPLSSCANQVVAYFDSVAAAAVGIVRPSSFHAYFDQDAVMCAIHL